MGERPAVAVLAPAAVPECHTPAQGQRFERRLGPVGERPWLEVGPAERQLRRLNADDADLTAVGQHDGVAVDDLDDHGRAAVDQRRRQFRRRRR